MSRETVEKYKVDKDHSGLTWLKTFADDEVFRNINDLNLIAEDEFYSKRNITVTLPNIFQLLTTSMRNKILPGFENSRQIHTCFLVRSLIARETTAS